MSEEIDYEELWRQQAEAREERGKKMLEGISALMDNSDGFERLEAITDEEWDAAQRADDAADIAALGVLEDILGET